MNSDAPSNDNQYTPGPLVALPEENGDGSYCVVIQPEQKVMTASYCTRADAILYARAPALLDALEAAVELFEVDNETDTPGTDAWFWLQSARDIIAEAKGSEPLNSLGTARPNQDEAEAE